jgi:uncharacterized membrane protein
MMRFTQEQGEHAISLVLRYGSLSSAVLMALGLALMLLRGSATALAGFHRVEAAVLLAGLVRSDPAAVTEAGVLLLLLTPILRIIVAVLSFALERDLKYVLISLGVLLIVALSIGFAILG